MSDTKSNSPPDTGEKMLNFEPPVAQDKRRFSRSVDSNHHIVAEAFLDNVPQTASVLEIGCGTGEHGIFISQQAVGLSWTFTDASKEALPGIAAWIEHAGRENLYGPYEVDASESDWGREIETAVFDVLFSANVLHISDFAVTEGLFAGADRLLSAQGKLLIYGPFARAGKMTDSNELFDRGLKSRNSSWGVRDLEHELVPLARSHNLKLELAAGMPKNNLMLFFKRT